MERWELARIDRIEVREEENAKRIRELERRELERFHLNAIWVLWICVAAVLAAELAVAVVHHVGH